MGRQTAEKAGLSQETEGNWPVPVQTIEIPPDLSPCSPPPTLQRGHRFGTETATLPPCGFSLDHEEMLNLSLRPGLQKMTNIPFAVLLGVFYDRNSFCGLIVWGFFVAVS